MLAQLSLLNFLPRTPAPAARLPIHLQHQAPAQLFFFPSPRMIWCACVGHTSSVQAPHSPRFLLVCFVWPLGGIV